MYERQSFADDTRCYRRYPVTPRYDHDRPRRPLTFRGQAENYDFPEMPISSGTPAYSERIDRRGVPETWLPMPASVQASAFKQTQRVTVLTSTGSTPQTRSMLSKNADEVGYWANLDADWSVETFFDAPNQYPDDND